MENKKYYIVYQITNKLNNKIYIGIHITENIHDKYMGSGSNIKKAIKEFGVENFEKIVLFNFDDKEKMLEKEKELVNDEFIKNGNTYNIILGGGGFNSYNLITVKDKDNNTLSVHKTDPRYLSGELVSIMKGLIMVKDKDNNTLSVNSEDPRYLSGEFQCVGKGFVVVKNKNNEKIRVSIDDPRYLSGELIFHKKGFITVKDNKNNTLNVSTNDPRYLSGELKHIFSGRKITDETKRKIGEKNSIQQKGNKNSQFNTCWIYNLNINKNKKIKKCELDEWIFNGWTKGRKINF